MAKQDHENALKYSEIIIKPNPLEIKWSLPEILLRSI